LDTTTTLHLAEVDSPAEVEVEAVLEDGNKSVLVHKPAKDYKSTKASWK
jgi:hypothetical protein